jgi:hypothetical protein
MKMRNLVESDIPVLREMHRKGGLAYDFPDLRGSKTEAVVVVADENNEPVAAAVAERLIQVSLLLKEDEHPAAKLHWVKLLHEGLASELSSKGYHEANCFIPPQLEKSFGRRLMRTFQWVRNWPSFARHF